MRYYVYFFGVKEWHPVTEDEASRIEQTMLAKRGGRAIVARIGTIRIPRQRGVVIRNGNWIELWVDNRGNVYATSFNKGWQNRVRRYADEHNLDLVWKAS